MQRERIGTAMNASRSAVFRLFLWALLCASVATHAVEVVEKGVSLQNNSLLSRPVTLLDFFVSNLNARAIAIQRERDLYTQGYKSPEGRSPSTEAGYDLKRQRIYLRLNLTAIRMDDPWRPICAKRATIFYQQFSLPSRDWDENSKKELLHRYTGPLIQLEPQKVSETIALLLDSIVTVVEFNMVADNGLLKAARVCYLDNKTGKVTYDEHAYK
jgi:hypothetical protein